MIDPRDTDTLAGLHDTLGSVTVPDIMHGDNLAITLCTAYDNPDQDADEETGWTPDAIAGQEAVLAAIRDHYDPAIRCAIALRAQAAKDKAEIAEARRRRDEWRKKAEGYDAVCLALREKVGAPWPPHLSRVMWAGLAAAEKKRADDAEARIARLEAALREIAKQKRANELQSAYEEVTADFEEGYDACVDRARAALEDGE